MFHRKKFTHTALRLAGSAALAILGWILAMNTHVGATTPSALLDVPRAKQISAQNRAQALPQNLQVLSPKDADLYRAAFAAQAAADWKAADLALSNLSDKRLLGHVLADRFLRRPASAIELRDWLAAYNTLPEAPDMYSAAHQLPAGKNIKFSSPNLADAWSGGDKEGASLGFKSGEGELGLSSTARASAGRIDHALRRGDPMTARALFEAEQAHRVITLGEAGEMDGRIASALFYQGQTDLARKVADEAVESQNPLALWISGLTAFKQNDAEKAGETFSKLATVSGLSSWDHAAAAFWAYRSLKRAGDSSQAHYWLEEAARQPRSFYGLLAAHLLGHETTNSWQLPELTAANIGRISHSAAGWRAIALLQIGEPALAESELRHLNPQGRHDLQEAMLALAEKTHMPSLALQLGGIATKNNGDFYDAALYPLPPWQPEQGFQVDRALLYALMRHESQFDPGAVSSRGACGLMQLMPATANLVANNNVSGDDCSARLLDPAFNMALGQKYVRHLASQPMIGDNLLLLLTAYNSGPTKLTRWLDDETRNDPLLFIESMPVRETRDYVQQVLIHYWMYRARLAEPQGSLTQLAHGEWPRTTLRDESPLHAKPKQAYLDDGYELASSQQ